MTAFTAFDAKTHFSALLRRVAAGEEITITRHGTPVARLVPVERKPDPKVAEAIERWRKRRQGITLGDDLTIRQLIDEGRRY